MKDSVTATAAAIKDGSIVVPRIWNETAGVPVDPEIPEGTAIPGFDLIYFSTAAMLGVMALLVTKSRKH